MLPWKGNNYAQAWKESKARQKQRSNAAYSHNDLEQYGKQYLMPTALSPYANGQSTAQAKNIHAMQHPTEKTVYNF